MIKVVIFSDTQWFLSRSMLIGTKYDTNKGMLRYKIISVNS
jgi:hypothetical protein